MYTTNRFSALVFAALLLGIVGCGSGNCSVSGNVAFPDGSPLTKGIVVFESPSGTGKGALDSSGHYVLGFHSATDGVPPGEYKVYIAMASTPDPNFVPPANEPDAAKYISLVAPEFESAASTPLRCKVERSGKHNFSVKAPPNP